MRMTAATLCLTSALLCQQPVAVPEGSSPDQIAALASTVRPSARQLAWQATGCNAFVHFGMNTFTDREWGDGSEDPSLFAPTDFDADQWAQTFAQANMSGLVLTCKHHDGFCLWPSATTEHDVASSPFRDGKGDVVAEVAAACKKRGLQFGIYLSPWDRNQKTFGTKAYEAVFLNQLRELLSNYGELFEIWFDGAHCPPDKPEVFDWQAVFQLVRELQPNAVIAITGPDVRWVGNEAGKTRSEEWSVLPLSQATPGPFAESRQSWRALWQLRARNQEPDLGSLTALRSAKALCWWPAETDVSIRPGWFYHPNEDGRVKSLNTLLDYWFTAVGGNAVLLLNVPADRRGQIAPPDQRVLQDLGTYLRATFAHNLADSDGATQKLEPMSAEILLPTETTVDVFELCEDTARTGQLVETFRIDVRRGGSWHECARGTTIGFRRLVRTEPVRGDGFRCTILRSRGQTALRSFALYRRPKLAKAPHIARAANGVVTIETFGLPVRYTTDGSPVGPSSPIYRAPFPLTRGGIVRARATPPNGSPPRLNLRTVTSSGESTARFGLAPIGWKVLDCSSEQGDEEAAKLAIDGNPETLWHTRYEPDTPRHPHHLAVDLGAEQTLIGFLYQPRISGSNGTIVDYAFEASADGTTWSEVARGTFDNMANNPTERAVRFSQPAKNVRFVRLTALREVAGRPWASVGELSVLVR